MAKRFLKTAVVSALFALTLAVSASAASAGGATTTTAVNFRTGAGTNYGIISTLPAGTHVVVSTRSSGGWATVVYNGTVGYISSDYLKRANEMDASFGTGTIDGSYVRMRSGAGQALRQSGDAAQIAKTFCQGGVRVNGAGHIFGHIGDVMQRAGGLVLRSGGIILRLVARIGMLGTRSARRSC